MSRSPKEILEQSSTIAVVGMSNDPDKAAFRIPAELMTAGFHVIPVNPRHTMILGQTSYPTLGDVPVPIDVVDVFRPPRDCPAVATEAVAVGAGAIWLQLGISSADARRTAEAAGLDYVEDLCIGVEVRRYGISHTGS